MEYFALIKIIEKIILVSLGVYVMICSYKLLDSELIALVSVFVVAALCNLIVGFF